MTTWKTPLGRATRVLSERLLKLETLLPDDPRDRDAWADYLQTCDLVLRLVELDQRGVAAAGPPEPDRRYAGRAERFKGRGA